MTLAEMELNGEVAREAPASGEIDRLVDSAQRRIEDAGDESVALGGAPCTGV